MRAISKNTRKATAITLAVALVIAVYLNWQYARTGVTLEEDAVNVSAVSQETVPVTDELMTEAEAVSSANKNYGEAQLVSAANNSGSKFFEEARLKLWGDRIFEKCGIRRDEGGDGGKTLEIRGKRRLSARDGGANYQQS